MPSPRLRDDSDDEDDSVDMPLPPSIWQRFDIGILILGLAILSGGAVVHRKLTTPENLAFQHEGLQFSRPDGWLPATEIQLESAPLARRLQGENAASDSRGYHVVFSSSRDARERIEVRIVKRPRFANLRGALAVDRVGRYGEFYWVRRTSQVPIARRDWQRTEFRYAFKATKGGSPQIAEGIEYAAASDSMLYVLTVHGSSDTIRELDELVAPSIRIESTPEEGRL